MSDARLSSLGVLLCTALALASCDARPSAYTLYRSSMASGVVRMHIATFDAEEGEEYNRENCQIAQDLFQKQPGVKVRYWCEMGRYRK